MRDVRTLTEQLRRRRQAAEIVDGLIARQAARRLAAKMADTAGAIAVMADAAVDATVGLMWLGAHLELPRLPEVEPWP